MGGSGKWLKSLIPVKKAPATDQEKQGKKKWRLWRSSSDGVKGGHSAAVSRPSDSSSDDGFAAAMATVARAPPRDFMAVKQEWAAIRIQTAFRGVLARRAFRALRAVVRLQAIFRGRQVRKQAAVTLRCMQALLRVQTRVRARNAGIFPEGEATELDDYFKQADPTKKAEQRWCDSPGTIDEVKAKLQMRQDAAIKRERAIAYSLTQQRSRSCGSPCRRTARSCGSPCRRTNNSGRSLKNQALDNVSSPGWSWLDRWVATKPWDNRLDKENHFAEFSEPALSRKSEDNIAGFYSYSSKHEQVKVRRNNVTTRVSAKPPVNVISHICRSSSAPSSESLYDEYSPSTSSTSVSPIPFSSKTLTVDNVVQSCNQKPSYMNPTESIKAKQRASRYYSDNVIRTQNRDGFLVRSMELSRGDNLSSAGSNPSSILCRDLYPPVPLGRRDGDRNRRY